jgi:hypothetical protein
LQTVVETGSMTFHNNPEDTHRAYSWGGDRIWPSSEYLSQDTAVQVHQAAGIASERKVGRHLMSAPPLAHRIHGTTPLMVAAARGNAACVHRLLSAGALPNEATSRMHSPSNERGVTALMCACDARADGSVDCADLLLSAGSKIDAQDVAGRTALHHAVLAGNADAVILLMRRGADTSIVDKSGRAAVDHALEIRSREQDTAALADADGTPAQEPQQRSIPNLLLYSDQYTLEHLN